MKKTILLILLFPIFSCSQTKKEITESYTPGFRIIQTADKSRIYKPDTDTTDNLHFRPLDIDIWYPARASETDSPLLFRDILHLLEKRANYYTASNKWTGITSLVAQSFCEGFKCSDTTRLLNFKTQSFMKASPVDKIFPLVIYLCAFNGMSYENFTLFETLAKNGFIVVSINSIGRYPGDMTMKSEDLLEQVDDAKASLNTIKQNSDIDFSKIGIIGYSWGGISGAILAGRIQRVSCLISLDGSEFHHYGEQKEEDTDFQGIRNSPEFQNLSLPVPYLRLESSNIISPNRKDSVYDFSEKLKNEKLIFKVDSAHHEDFSSLSVIVRESGNCPSNANYGTILNLTLAYLEDHLKNEHSFSHLIEQEINKSITKK
jgi:hypothetical protein